MAAGQKRTRGSNNARMGRVMPPIDVNDAKMVKELKKRIEKGPLTLILVHAEWCGHCQTYKPKFAKLENNKNRSIQIARVREDIYPSLGIENGNIEGYPSVIAVSPANKALNFKGENGERSNTIPDHNDMTMMNTIVENGLPESGVSTDVESEKMNSMNVSRPLNSQINKNISNAIENMPPSVNGSAIPPDTSSDSIYEKSMMANRTKNNNSLVYKPPYGQKQMTGGNCGCGGPSFGGQKGLTGGQKGLTGGSSLYGLLTSVASEAAAPALLLGAAAYLSKRKAKGSRKTRKAPKRKSRSTRRK